MNVLYHSTLATLGILGLQIYANNETAGALLRFTSSQKVRLQQREKHIYNLTVEAANLLDKQNKTRSIKEAEHKVSVRVV